MPDMKPKTPAEEWRMGRQEFYGEDSMYAIGDRLATALSASQERVRELEGRIDAAVAYIYGEDDPDMPGMPWAIQHIVRILDEAERGGQG